MAEIQAERKQIMVPRAASVWAWTLAWAFTGTALHISGVFNSPRTGPLWVALAGGAVSWSLAGAFSFPAGARDSSGRWKHASFLIWALAYLVSFVLAAFAGRALADTIGGLMWMLAGWSLGPGLGAFASTWLLSDRSRVRRSIIVGAIWALGFFAGSYIALVGLYLIPELAKLTMGSLTGVPLALALGSAVGGAPGGLVGSVVTLGLTRLITTCI